MTRYRLFRALTIGLLGGFLLMVVIAYLDGAWRFNRKHVRTHPEIKPYMDRVYKISGGKISNKIKAGLYISPKKNKNVIGSCTLSIFPLEYEIDISPLYWAVANDKERLLLIAHEMRHCVCKEFVHYDDKFQDGCHKSYMSAVTESDKCVNDHFDDYLTEISKGCYVSN